ncbi:MAG: hypothetical protein ACREVE_09210 [Gammaproteobacteria bacterium]
MDQLVKFLWELVAYGGGAAAISYLLFQYLGKTWIENKFSQKLDQLRHQQALELQRLRVEIDSLLSGALKLQEREFQVLPEAWEKLDEAHRLVSWLVSPMQEYPNLDRLNKEQLEEFLAMLEFPETQKDELRAAQNKVASYRDIVFWHRLHKVKSAFADLQRVVARNAIFFPAALKHKFSSISEMLWSALISMEVGTEANDYKMQREGWTKIKEEIEPLYKSIEADIQVRLHSHGHKA